MSDLCMYELEDNVWDEFGESDDRMMPHPIDGDGDGDGDGDKCAVEGGNRKKARHEVIGVTGNANDETKHTIHGNDETPMVKDALLEKGSWSQTADGLFPSSSDGDSVKEVTGLTNNDARKVGSVGSELCANDLILADSNSNSYDYPLSRVSQTDNELSFYDNDGGDKESNELLFYGWPDIGNFEDVDRMFRSSDSTFGLGSLSNDDELCWFSHSQATGGPEEVLNSDFKLSCPYSEQSAPLMGNNTGPSVDDSDQKSVSLWDKVSTRITDDEDLEACCHIPLDAKSENDYQDEQMMQRKQSKHHKLFSSPDERELKQNIEPAPLTHMQTHRPYMHIDFSNPSVQISIPTLPGNTKFEDISYPFPSPEESSLASNQAQSLKSSHGLLPEPATGTSEKRKRVHARHDIANPTTACNSISVGGKNHQPENEIDGHSEVDGVGVPAELDSSNVQESTCMSSVLDESSPQATSLRQLQQVTEQLDIRTKLCIRDSLYRLARSAAQRHCTNGAFGADEANKSTGFMDIETNTNPIDRSIAHLLFHRPLDPSVIPANDASSLKSHAMSLAHPMDDFDTQVHGSVLNPPMMSEKQIFPEIAAGTDNKLPRDSEK